jgi:hypothetical protein
MSDPKINDRLFQTWVLDHSQVLMNGSRRLDDLVLLYGSAFHDGWFQALGRVEPAGKPPEDIVQSADSQLLEFESKRPTSRLPVHRVKSLPLTVF